MKPTIEQPKIERSANFEEITYSVEQEDLPHLFSILRNSLYSDKPLAIVRELSANAVDAHVEAGKANVPIQVTLPNKFNPEFKVRDFGLGLTYEDMKTVYTRYCKSTKRNTNAQIGMLGIGAKSPWCLVDSFTINSYVNGEKTTYNAYIDETRYGKLAILNTSATKEPDGLEVIVCVPNNLIDSFVQKAVGLYRFYSVSPLLKGSAEHKQIMPFIYTIKTNEWGYDANASIPQAIMGGVAYELDRHAIDNLTQEQAQLLDCGIHIFFNIGDIQVSANRESLEYSSQTNAAIKVRLNKILKEILLEVNKKFENCKNLYEAKLLYSSLYSSVNYGHSLESIVGNKITWGGFKINDSYFSVEDTEKGNVIFHHFSRSRRWNSQRVLSGNNSYINCTNKNPIYFCDLKTIRGINRRAATLLFPDDNVKNVDSVQVIWCKDALARKSFEQSIGFSLDYFPKISTVEKKPLQKSNGIVTSAEGNKKYSDKFFEFDPSKAKSYYNRGYGDSPSDAWLSVDLEELDDEEKVYIVIDKFLPYGASNSLEHLKNNLSNLNELGIEVETLYGVKVAAATDLKSDWVELKSFVEREIKKIFSDSVLAQNLADGLEFARKGNVCPNIRSFLQKINEFELSGKFREYLEAVGLLKDIHSKINKFVFAYSSLPEGWRKENLLPKSSFDLGKLFSQVKAKYSLLEILHRSYGITSSQWDDFILYVNCIDRI